MAVFTKIIAIGPTVEAGEALAAGDNVCIADDGKLYKADADAATRRPCVGAVDVAVEAGQDAAVITCGWRNDGSSLNEGAQVYLSTTAGAETQTAGAGKQVLGIAWTPTVWYFNPQQAYNIPTA